MAVNASSIYSAATGTTLDTLRTITGRTNDNIKKEALSSRLKNNDTYGAPNAAAVEVRRVRYGELQSYGTARASGAQKLRDEVITVVIDQKKEYSREIDKLDFDTTGIEGVGARISSNASDEFIIDLDKAFFTEAATAATAKVSEEEDLEDALEEFIQNLETLSDTFTEGVDRSKINLVLRPKFYSKLRNQLDVVARNANIDTAAEEVQMWHGVKVYSSIHLPAGCDCLVMIDGAVAQPIHLDDFTEEKIPYTRDIGFYGVLMYGTKAVYPNCIFKCDMGLYVEQPTTTDDWETLKAAGLYKKDATTGLYTKVGDNEARDADMIYYKRTIR